MNPKLCVLCVILGAAVTVSCGPAARPVKPGVSLTVYSAPGSSPQTLAETGFAVINERREVTLSSARQQRLSHPVSARLVPSSVRMQLPGAQVLEQTFVYDLADASTLLSRFVGQEIGVSTLDGAHHRGRLLLASGGGYLMESEGSGERFQLLASEPIARLELGAPEQQLQLHPELQWLVQTEPAEPASRLMELSYQSDGLGWAADYQLVIGSEAGSALSVDLLAWLTLVNQSGVSFSNAELTLMAGDVQRFREELVFRDETKSLEEDYFGTTVAQKPVFEEESFFEYHMYRLNVPIDLPEQSFKQLELFSPKRDISARKVLQFGARQADFVSSSPRWDEPFAEQALTPLDIVISFVNDEEAGLGLPLPAGRVRLMGSDPQDGAALLLGETWLEHTPKGEELRFLVGRSTFVFGRRVQKSYSYSESGRWIKEGVELELVNRGSEAAELSVIERLPRWSNWSIEGCELPFVKEDANHIRFSVSLAAGESRTLSYVAHYRW
ncbi:MAG: hypothetical protein RBU37_16775 [Myxococcota bacterium]|jgi:hypothetical protein|nr:hypothetical protein [Myxococcota bacterium]